MEIIDEKNLVNKRKNVMVLDEKNMVNKGENCGNLR